MSFVGSAWRIVMLGLLGLLAAGCADPKPINPKTTEEFDAVIMQNPQPVLMDFYKGGCPSCILLDPVMDDLADEYDGHAVVAKFMLMTPTFGITSKELDDRYDIAFYPTVILFENGLEKKRWVAHYLINDYRHALDEAIKRMGESPASQP